MLSNSLSAFFNQFHRVTWDIWLLGILFLVTLPIVNPYIRGDGVGYYAYVRSVVIDRDLSFENEYRRGDPAFRGNAFDENGSLKEWLKLPNKFVRNQWALGSSLLWSPFFIITHGIVLCLNRFGLNILADGYSLPYRLSCSFGTALYSFIGLLLALQVAKRFSSAVSSVIATIGIWFGSSLPVSMYLLPFQAHALAAFSVSLFIWYWIRTLQKRTLSQWFLWGLMGGLVIDVYNINAIFLLVPMFDLFKETKKCGMIKNGLINGVSFSMGGFVALLPHWLTKWIIYGSPFFIGHIPKEPFYWSSPRLWSLGFSAEHGMFLWTPLLFISLLGLIFFVCKERWIGGCLLATLIVFYYVIASYEAWHGLSSFGSRFFIAFSEIFVIGLAIFIDKTRISIFYFLEKINIVRSKGMNNLISGVICAIIAVFIYWNIGFIYQWGANFVPNRGPVDFRVVARNQITVVPQKLMDFTFHYLIDREQIIQDIERKDLVEMKKYQQQR